MHPKISRIAMKDGLHPEYSEVTITLADGSEITTRSTMDQEEYESEVDSSNHPFYTGRRQFVDTAGRVEKFNRRYGLNQDDDEEEDDDA
jgi:large subunit ribosomal protein L31